MTVYRDFAYIVDSRDDGTSPLLTVDVSDPAQPRVASQETVHSGSVKIVAAGNYLYAMGQNALTALDVSHPAIPRQVGVHGWAPNNRGMDLFVGRGVLYAMLEDGLSVLPLHAPRR